MPKDYGDYNLSASQILEELKKLKQGTEWYGGVTMQTPEAVGANDPAIKERIRTVIRGVNDPAARAAWDPEQRAAFEAAEPKARENVRFLGSKHLGGAWDVLKSLENRAQNIEIPVANMLRSEVYHGTPVSGEGSAALMNLISQVMLEENQPFKFDREHYERMKRLVR